jgi:RHS repeat-associated protein
VDATRSETLTFTYDELDRLDTVSGPSSHNYDCNTIGNITNKNTTTYTYGNSAHKHAVSALSTGETYGYDANGNTLAPHCVRCSAGVTSRVEGGSTYTQAFNTENLLTSVTMAGQTTTFAYDPDGNLVKKINPDGSKTLYIAGIYEVNKNSGGSVIGTVTYYPEAGAMRVDSTPYYVLKDHLGSASVITDNSGITVGEQRYYPFGETRVTTGSIPTDKLFTGQQAITGLGIYHYGARFYSPKLGRFLSADSVIPSYADPQQLNRFSYVGNNPLRYTDPDGHRMTDGVDGGGGGCGAVCLKRQRAAQLAAQRARQAAKATPTPVRTPIVTHTPALTVTPQPIRVPIVTPTGTPVASKTIKSTTSIGIQTNITYTGWSDSPHGPGGWDVDFAINVQSFLSKSPLEIDIHKGNWRPGKISYTDEYRYKINTTTITTTTATTILDQYNSPMSTAVNVSTTGPIIAIYQQARITISPPGKTWIETGRNMCGTMLPC